MRYRLIITMVVALLTTTLNLSAASPQREAYKLSDDWLFYFASAPDAAEAQTISLPHSWDAMSLGGITRESVANYVRKLYVPQSWGDRRLFMRFGGVNSVADLFVNGSYVGTHKGGFTAFTFEITDKVNIGADNMIRVVVSDAWRSDVLPLSSDLDLLGGIYRDVELLVTPRNIISPLYYGSDGVFVVQQSVSKERVSGVVKCHLSLSDIDHPNIVVRIIGPDGYLVDKVTSRAGKLTAGRSVDIPFEIDRPVLWSPDNPEMYSFEIYLGSEDSALDSVSVRTGFRTIAVDGENRLCINGEPYVARGVGLAHDRKGVGMALSHANIDADLDMILDMGANAVRSLSGPHDRVLYERCDREGLLCWIDAPYTRSLSSFSDVCYYPTADFRDNGKTQLMEIMAQNFNHPSVVMWGLFWGVWQRGDDVVDYVAELNEVVKSFDKSRPTVGCSNKDGAINFSTDIIVFYQDVGWYKGSYSDVSVWCRMLSTNKQWEALRYGVCYGEEGVAEHHTDILSRAQRGARLLPERRQRRQHEDYAAIIDTTGSFWGSWLNSMFDYASPARNTGINHSGVVGYDHATPKDAYYLYRAMWNADVPTLHIADRSWRERRDTLQQIDVYSSVGEPIILVGGDTVKVQNVAPARYHADSVVIKGRARIEAYDASGIHRDAIDVRCGEF